MIISSIYFTKYSLQTHIFKYLVSSKNQLPTSVYKWLQEKEKYEVKDNQGLILLGNAEKYMQFYCVSRK